MSEESNYYGYESLSAIPSDMAPWNMRLEQSQPSQFGQYVLVSVEQAGQELHHEVEVLDESGFPLRSVWVVFGFPGGGPDINLPVRENYWVGSPAVLKGNAQKTSTSGYVQHTFKSGGEDIWIWDVDKNGILRLPSPIVKNCTWQRTPVGVFEHTGVKLTFQRRMKDVISLQERLRRLENQMSTNGGGSNLSNLEQRIQNMERIIG